MGEEKYFLVDISTKWYIGNFSPVGVYLNVGSFPVGLRVILITANSLVDPIRLVFFPLQDREGNLY